MKEALGALRAGVCSAGALLFLAVLDCSAVATSAADFSTDVVLLLLAGLGCSTGVAFTADFFADVTLLLVDFGCSSGVASTRAGSAAGVSTGLPGRASLAFSKAASATISLAAVSSASKSKYFSSFFVYLAIFFGLSLSSLQSLHIEVFRHQADKSCQKASHRWLYYVLGY